MPFVLLDRIPLPSLRTYTSISILLFSISLYYAISVTSDPNWALNYFEDTGPSSDHVQDDSSETLDSVKILLHKLLLNEVTTKRIFDIIYVLVEEAPCVWILVNMVYCTMILIGKCIQKIVFGDLRVIEQQHIKDKFYNFVFYKFIFVFGVMNVQFMDEVVMWCGWFSFVGAFSILATLCKDRFDYLSFSPTTPKWTHLRMFSLLFFILAMSVSLCTVVGLYSSPNIFFFMAAEWALVTIKTLYVLIKYVIHLYDVTHEGIWENRGKYNYYCELFADLSSLVVDFLHHLHMLLWRNIFLSVASLVICMQLRYLGWEIQHKIMKHKNYLKVSRHMEQNFPLATPEEIHANSDDCAICWEKMEAARKLSCGHMFHTSCLHSWMEQVTNCPTCRTALVSKENARPDGTNLQGNQQPNTTTNHFFHFDGSRYVSWLPSFSVEVSHTTILGDRPQTVRFRTSQLDDEVGQVLHMFPDMPYNMVLEDLLRTRALELTIENILEERLVAPVRPPSTFPLIGASPESLRSNLQNAPAREDSSDSGLSDNTVKTEESTIVTGGDGCRFSKNSQERESMLSVRKDELMRKARSKYIGRILRGPPNAENSLQF